MKKIINYFVYIIIIIIIIILYQQNRSISILKNKIEMPLINQSIDDIGINSIIENENKKQQIDLVKNFIDTSKIISGSIYNISENEISINAIISDIKDIEKDDLTKPTTRELIEKKYKIKINEKTIFVNKEITDLQIDDIIKIYSDISIYNSNELLANKIEFIYNEKN